MLRASSSFLIVLSLALGVPALAQRARNAPRGLVQEKALLLGPAGSMLPEGATLGPFGDVDGDSDVDFLHGGSVHLNEGFGDFRASKNVAIEQPRLAFFRADPDGDIDLLTRTRLYLGDGTGRFDDAGTNLPAGFEADAAAIADLDGDGDEDLLSVRRHTYSTPASIRLDLNDGSGVFTPSSSALPAVSFPYVAVAGDVDGDLDIDLVIGSWFEQLWLNDGAGGFVHASAALPAVGDDTIALAFADVDGDTDLDLVIGNNAPGGGSPGPERLLRNDGTGTFTPSSFPGNGPPYRSTKAILVVDREDDGDLDLVLLHSIEAESTIPFYFDAPNRLLVNDGTGTFAESPDLPAIRGANETGFAGDVDGDGDPDLVIGQGPIETGWSAGGIGPYPHRLFLNDGHGVFQSAWSGVLGLAGEGDFGARVAAIGDLNGDGLPDGFTPQAIFVNDPPGVLTRLGSSLPYLPSHCQDWEPFPRAVDVALGDVEGDGDLDAYIAGPGEPCGGAYLQSNRLWTNDGHAGFADETVARLPQDGEEIRGNPRQVFLIELDGDGDLDAACVRNDDSDGGGYSSCYTNDGSGHFTRKENLGYATSSGNLGDLDGDGDADYFEGGARAPFTFDHPNAVWWNDGSAHFVLSTAIPWHPVPPAAVESTLIDIEQDGDLDIYVSCEGSSRSSFVYVNRGTCGFRDETARLPDGLGEGITVADVDVNGFPDLVTSTSLFLNDEQGFFFQDHVHTRRWAYGRYLAAGDLDLDGDPDFLTVDPVHTTLAVSFARHLESVGPARIGKRMSLVVHGPPWEPFALYESLGTVRFPLGSIGWLLVHPGRVLSTTSGYLDRDGKIVLRRMVPSSTALLGRKTYWQAFVGSPSHSTNLVVSTFTGL